MFSIDELDPIQKLIFRCVSDISFLIRCRNSFEDSSSNKNNENDLYIKCNGVIKNKFCDCSLIKSIFSVEDKNINILNNDGKYFLSYEPLDGFFSINSNITIGSIFCVFEYYNNTITNGYNIVMACYSLYGGCTQLVISKYGKVNMYNLNPLNENWILSNKEITIQDNGSKYSINYSKEFALNKNIKNYIDWLIKKKYKEFSGEILVLDFHRILLNGGILAYISNNYYISVLCKAYPLAYIINSAEGKSTNGNIPILKIDFPWNNVLQKTRIFYGSYYEMLKLNDFQK